MVFGGAGSDQIFAGAGNDVIEGGAGDDRVWGDDGDDTVIATANDGNDVYYGDAGIDTLDYAASSATSPSTSETASTSVVPSPAARRARIPSTG